MRLFKSRRLLFLVILVWLFIIGGAHTFAQDVSGYIISAPDPFVSRVLETDAPQAVQLSSLEVDQEVPHVSNPDVRFSYSTLTLDEPKFVEISLIDNEKPTRLSIADRMRGVFAYTTNYSGRTFPIRQILDAGEYLIELQTEGEDFPEVSVSYPQDVESDPFRLLNAQVGILHETTLHPGELRTMWVEVSPGEKYLHIEAAGRALNGVSVWKDGDVLVENVDRNWSYMPIEGRQMFMFDRSIPVEPGMYKIVFWAGSSYDWADGSAEMPLYVRAGFQYLGQWVDRDITIPVTGNARFTVASDVIWFELTDPGHSGARMTVSANASRSGESVTIKEDDEESTVRLQFTGRTEFDRLVVVRGNPGQRVHVRAYTTEWDDISIEGGNEHGVFYSSINAGTVNPSIDTTPVFWGYPAGKDHPEIIEVLAVTASPQQPVSRSLMATGIQETVYGFFVNFTRGGRWAILTDTPRDVRPTKIEIMPAQDMLSLNSRTIREPVLNNPFNFEIEPGLYYIRIAPQRHQDVQQTRMHIYFRGKFPIFKDMAARTALRRPVNDATVQKSWIGEPFEADEYESLAWRSNEVNRPLYSMFAAGLPFHFGDGVQEEFPVFLEAGEEMELPAFVPLSGTMRSSNPQIRVSVQTREQSTDLDVPALLSVVNTSDEGQLAILRYIPDVSRFEGELRWHTLQDLYPLVESGQTVFADYSGGESKTYLLTIDEPGFYSLGTDGEGENIISLRSPANTQTIATEFNKPQRADHLQSYLRKGRYLVTVTAGGSQRKRIGLDVQPVRVLDLGRIAEGERIINQYPPDTWVLGHVEIGDFGDYAFSKEGLNLSPDTRLENSDGWIVTSTSMEEGSYRYWVWGNLEGKRSFHIDHIDWFAISYDRVSVPQVDNDNREIRTLPLNSQVRGSWNNNEKIEPHRYSLDIPIDMDVHINFTSRLEWVIWDSVGNMLQSGMGNSSFTLPRSASILEIHPHPETAYAPVYYLVTLVADMLLDGTSIELEQRQTTLPLFIEVAGYYDIWSMSGYTLAAQLFSDGELVAESDPDSNEFNFTILAYLEPGEYLLSVRNRRVNYSVGTPEIYCALRPITLTEAIELPFLGNIQLGRQVIDIPLSPAQWGEVSFTVNAVSVPLRLFSGNEIIAEGRGSLTAELEPGENYLLRIVGISQTLDSVLLEMNAAQ